MPDQTRPGWIKGELTDESDEEQRQCVRGYRYRRHRSRRLPVKADLVTLLIRALRQRGLTQSKAARLCGIDQPTLSKVLNASSKASPSTDRRNGSFCWAAMSRSMSASRRRAKANNAARCVSSIPDKERLMPDDSPKKPVFASIPYLNWIKTEGVP